MPNQNLNQINVSGIYYVHIFGVVDQELLYCDSDYHKFLDLIGELLANHKSIEVLAYCLAEDHIDLLLTQKSDNAIHDFMRQIINIYNEYFYEKYGYDDVLSELNCTTKLIHSKDLLAVSRELHIKKDNWLDCPFSSVRAYLYDDMPEWLNKKQISEVYGSAVKYFKFLKSKQLFKKSLL